MRLRAALRRLPAGIVCAILTVVPAAWIALAGVRFLTVRVDQALAQLTPVAVAETSAWLERPVRIKSIKPVVTVSWLLAVLRRPDDVGDIPIEMRGVELGARPVEAKVLGRDWLARAETVSATISAPGLAGDDRSGQALPKVRVNGLDLVVVRAPDGSWPIARLFPKGKRPPDPKRPPFRTRLEFRDSKVEVVDWASGSRKRRQSGPVTNRFDLDRVDIDLSGSRLIHFAGKAVATPGSPTAARLAGDVRVDGSIARGRPGKSVFAPARAAGPFTVMVRARGVDIPYAASYLPWDIPARITRGRGDIDLAWMPRWDAPVDVLVRGEVWGVDADLAARPEAPIRDASGKMEWSGGVLAGTVDGQVAGVRIRGSAVVDGSLAGARPRVLARLEPTSVPVATVRRFLPEQSIPRDLILPATMEIGNTVVRGPIDSPSVKTAVVARNVQWKDVPSASRLTLPLSWDRGVLNAGPLAGDLAEGGSLGGRVHWESRSGVGRTEIALRGVPLGGFGAIARQDALWRPRGLADADIQLGFRTGLRRGVAVSGRVVGTVRKPALGGLRFDRSEFSVEVAGSRLALRRARLSGDAGLVDVTGEFGVGQPLRLEGRLIGVDLAALSLHAGWQEAAGVLSSSVRIDGEPEAPTIRLDDFSILGPRVSWGGREVSADSLRGDGIEIVRDPRGTGWTARAQNPVRVALVPAEVLVQGAVTGIGSEPRLDLDARISQLDIERVLPGLMASQVGWAPGWLRDDPLWAGLASDLGWVAAPPDVTGRIVSAQGRITGPLETPALDARFDVRRAKWADLPLDSLRGGVRYGTDGWEWNDLEAESALGRLRGVASLPADGALRGRFEINPLRLAGLGPWTGESVALGGTVALSATLSGTADTPVVSGSLRVVDPVDIGGVLLEPTEIGDWNVSGSRSPEGNWSARFAMGRFLARVAGTDVAVSGIEASWPGGNLDAQVEWAVPRIEELAGRLQELPVLTDRLNQWLRSTAASIPPDVDMRLRSRARVTGRSLGSDEPVWEAKVSLDGSDARVGPVRFPVATAAMAFRGRTLTMEGLRFEGPAAIVDGAGSIEFPTSEAEGIGLDLRLESLSPSLELVRAFDPDFPLFGDLDSVTIVAQGTTRSPRIQATAEGSGLVFKTPDRPPLSLDRIRVNARVLRDRDGDLLLGVDDGLIVRGDEEIRWDIELPIDADARRVVASRPIRRMEARARGVKLATLAAFAKLPVENVEGQLTGRLALEGTLNQPSLRGEVRVDAGEARFVRVGTARRGPANDISELALALEMAGREVRVRKARLALGSPAAQPDRPGGALDVDGVLRLDNLEDFTQLFVRPEAGARPPQLRGTVDLVARLQGIRPDIDNLTGLAGMRDLRGQLGLSEAGRATVDGTVTITGSLLEPLVATRNGNPLRLGDVFLRLPRPSAVVATRPAPVIDPRWRIEMAVPGDARVVLADTPVVRLEFLGRGNVQLAGALSQPTIVGTLAPTGGYLRYPLARLDLQRGGTARIEYGGQRVGVSLAGVSAEGKITGVGGGGGRRSDSALVNVGLGAAGTLLETTYRIQATFNGGIDLSGTSGTDLLQQVGLSAEPPLSRQQILELLGARRQFDLFTSGDIEQAMLGIGRRFADTGLVSGLFRPLTTNVRSAFGLDVFDVNYSLNGTAFVRVVRRLPEPMDRFTVEFGQSFLNREASSNRLPYQFGVNYELFQFQQRRWFVPRLLLGVAASSEQRDTLSFIRGSVNY